MDNEPHPPSQVALKVLDTYVNTSTHFGSGPCQRHKRVLMGLHLYNLLDALSLVFGKPHQYLKNTAP